MTRFEPYPTLPNQRFVLSSLILHGLALVAAIALGPGDPWPTRLCLAQPIEVRAEFSPANLLDLSAPPETVVVEPAPRWDPEPPPVAEHEPPPTDDSFCPKPTPTEPEPPRQAPEYRVDPAHLARIRPPEPPPEPVATPKPTPPPAITTPTALTANNEAPRYPNRAIRLRLEGTVLIRVTVDANGAVTNCHIEASSGHRILDSAALAAVRTWSFRDGPGVVCVPIEFVLHQVATN